VPGSPTLPGMADQLTQQIRRRWAIAAVSAVAITVAVGIVSNINDTAPTVEPTIGPSDRAPYAEVACEGFAHDAGMAADDGETSLITNTAAHIGT
jgi:hypothetical protein